MDLGPLHVSLERVDFFVVLGAVVDERCYIGTIGSNGSYAKSKQYKRIYFHVNLLECGGKWYALL